MTWLDLTSDVEAEFAAWAQVGLDILSRRREAEATFRSYLGRSGLRVVVLGRTEPVLTCVCGCGQAVEGPRTKRWATQACRSRHNRRRKRYPSWWERITPEEREAYNAARRLAYASTKPLGPRHKMGGGDHGR